MSRPNGGGAPGRDPEDAARIAATIRRLLPPSVAPPFTPSFVRSHALYDEFVYRLALRVFRQMGLEGAMREAGSAEEIVARAGLDRGRAVVPVDWILRHLATRRVLEPLDAGLTRFRARTPLPAPDPAPLLAEQRQHDPSWLPSYVMAAAVAGDYPAFLRGEAVGEEILFSPARFQLWLDYFSNDHGLYAVNNQVGAIAVETWMPPGAGGILELGGGLASGATALLERLQAAGRLDELTEYRFTEFVPAFLRRGQRILQGRFPEASWLTFGQVDMNRPFPEQGIARGSLSLIYGVNTLHVAHDLRFTLGEILRALRPGGRLILSECVRPWPRQTIYAEFIFNLMETFRSPRLDATYRGNGGFLTPEQWRGAMEAVGYGDVRFLPDIGRLRTEVPDFYVAAIGATRPA